MKRNFLHLVIALGIILVTVCSFKSVLAQKSESQTKTELPPLVLKVTTSTPKICFGAKGILLRAEIKNVSRRTVTIDKYFLWNNSISINYERKTGGGGGAAMTGGSIHGAGDFLQLASAQTYQDSSMLSFTENNGLDDFFHLIGNYTITIKYKAIHLKEESAETIEQLYTDPIVNTLKIQVIKCRRKSKF